MRRVDQLLSTLGYCARRESRQWIDAGRVTLEGVKVRSGAERVDPAALLVDGEPLDHPEGLLLLLHKPRGLVCSHQEREGPNVYALLPERWRRRHPTITSVGRLDKETSGLLLLTDQSDLVQRLTSPRHKVPRIYRAVTDRDLPDALVPLFATGTLQLDGEEKPCAPAILKLLGPREAEITVTEGRYHQVRRMFAAAAGITLLALHRVAFGSLELGELPAGHWRELPRSHFARPPAGSAR